jgi:hypothetical protein
VAGELNGRVIKVDGAVWLDPANERDVVSSTPRQVVGSPMRDYPCLPERLELGAKLDCDVAANFPEAATRT